jgi:hypothetical protein
VDVGKTVLGIKIAGYDLAGLETDLREPTLLFVKGKLTLAKAKVAKVAYDKYLGTYSGFSRILADKDFEKLPGDARAQTDWLVGVIGRLSDQEKSFEKGWKLAKAGPEAKRESIIKHCKLCIPELRTPPKTLAKLAKRMIKGEEPEADVLPFVAFLPLAILSWAMADMIEEGLGARPR